MYTRVTLFSVKSIVVLHIKSSTKSQYAVDRKEKKKKRNLWKMKFLLWRQK